MSKRLFVSNIPFSVYDQDLLHAIAEFSLIPTYSRIMTDKETGNSRGFAFVEFASEAEAKTALDMLSGYEMDGRALRVEYARERTTTPGTGGGGFRPQVAPRATTPPPAHDRGNGRRREYNSDDDDNYKGRRR